MRRLLALLLLPPLLGGGVHAGNRAYRTGDARRAVEVYTRALERGDSSAAVRYNLGTALVRLGRHDEARPHLEAAAAARTAAQLRQRAHYNAGNADLEPVFRRRVPQGQRVERLERAVARYKRALLADPNDVDAKWNLELAQRLLDRERQGGGGGGEQQQGGGGSGGEEEQPSPRQGPAPAPAPTGPSTPQLSPEEVERILSGAQRQEREVQREVREKDRGTARAVRDW
jgi:Ca-activated chloride channel homolog